MPGPNARRLTRPLLLLASPPFAPAVSSAYKDACCSNKRPGTQGCPLPPPPPVGSTCASRGPKYADSCCSELSDPSVDPSCGAWTTAGTCADVRGKDLQTACW